MVANVPTIKLVGQEHDFYFVIEKKSAEQKKFDALRDRLFGKGIYDKGEGLEYRDSADLLSRYKITKQTGIIVAIKKHGLEDEDFVPFLKDEHGKDVLRDGERVPLSPGYNVGETFEKITKITTELFKGYVVDLTSIRYVHTLLKNQQAIGAEQLAVISPQLLGAERVLREVGGERALEAFERTLKEEEEEAKRLKDAEAKKTASKPTAAATSTPAKPPAATTVTPKAGAKGNIASTLNAKLKQDGDRFKTTGAVSSNTDSPGKIKAAADAAKARANSITPGFSPVKVRKPDPSPVKMVQPNLHPDPGPEDNPVFTIETVHLSEKVREKLSTDLQNKGLKVLSADNQRYPEFNLKKGLLIKIEKYEEGQPGWTSINSGRTIKETYHILRECLPQKIALNANPEFIATLKQCHNEVQDSNIAALVDIQELIWELEGFDPNGPGSAPNAPAAPNAPTAPDAPALSTDEPAVVPAKAPAAAAPVDQPKATVELPKGKEVEKAKETKGFFSTLCSTLASPFTWLWTSLKSLWKSIFG